MERWIAQRIAERLPSADDFLGQVLRGFQSGDASLGIEAIRDLTLPLLILFGWNFFFHVL